MDELKSDVKEIKSFVVELVKQGAIHNTILKEHERRSTNLETRMVPIEQDHIFRTKLSSYLIGGGGIIGLLLAALKLFF